MDSFDFFYIDTHRPDPHPLTQVDFFHAKHRAIKNANAVAAARGLPPRKSAALYIDMAVVRNFDHYDDIGALPNDPVVRELVRRQEMEAAEAKHQGKSAEQTLEKRERALKKALEAREEKFRRAEAIRVKEELQRAEAREETRKRVREAFNWQPQPGAGAAPPIHAPKHRKRKHAEVEGDEDANKERAVDPVIDNSKENNAFNKWLANIPMPSIELDVDQENSLSKGRKPRVILDLDDEEGVSVSTIIKSEADVA